MLTKDILIDLIFIITLTVIIHLAIANTIKVKTNEENEKWRKVKLTILTICNDNE